VVQIYKGLPITIYIINDHDNKVQPCAIEETVDNCAAICYIYYEILQICTRVQNKQ